MRVIATAMKPSSRNRILCVTMAACSWAACSSGGGGSGSLVDGGPEGGAIDGGSSDALVPLDAVTNADVGTKNDSAVTDAGTCGEDADIRDLDLVDAALGDGGSGSVGLCNDCIQSNCASQVDACQNDCACRTVAVGFFDCIQSGNALTSCGGSLIGAGATAQAIGLCAVNSGCGSACGGT